MSDIYLCESSCLVRKNILDLTQIIRQIPAPSKRRLIGFLIPNILVEVNERSLACPYSLDGDVKGNRYDVLEGDKRECPCDETVDRWIITLLVVVVEPRRPLWVKLLL